MEVTIRGMTKKINYISHRTGNRLLGVRMSANGTFNEEFQFRVNQSSEFATLINQANIDRHEAHLIYTTRIKPTIQYPLSITTFTDEQCREIQKPLMNAILPKMGFNRKMPRVVCYGPKIMGGVNIIKIEYNQIIRHIMIMRKHIYNNDYIGKKYIELINTYQKFIGCNKFFMKEDPKNYPYRPKSDKNSITYLWEKVNQYEIEIDIEGIDYENERQTFDHSIMDIVAQRKKISDQENNYDARISDHDISVTNYCRLSIGITWISQIFHNQNDKIKDEILNLNTEVGPERVKKSGNIRSEEMKQIWKRTIRKSMLVRGYFKWPNLPLIVMEKNNSDTPTEIENDEDIENEINKLGEPLKSMFDKLTINREVFDTIKDTPENGLVLTAWSDGSLMDGKLGHGFIIRTDDKNAAPIFEGAGSSIKGSLNSSLRAEHCGALCIIILINVLEGIINHGKNITVTTYIDNQTVVERLNHPKKFNPDCTDSDLWLKTIKMLEKNESRMSFKHVKAHQDKVMGPLTWEQFNNVTVDVLAKEGRTINGEERNAPRIEEPISINVNGVRVTAKHGRCLYNHIAGRELRGYQMEKFDWNERIFECVDWNCYAAYMNTIGPTKIANIIKYTYNWQYTKKRESKINQARKKTVGTEEHEDDRNEVTCNEQCPLRCGCNEDHQHYLSCSKLQNMKNTIIARRSFKRWIEVSKTEPKLKKLIEMVIDDMGNGEINTQRLMERVESNELKELITEQESIGWFELYKGLITKRFCNIQTGYYKKLNDRRSEENLEELPRRFTGEYWTKNFIKHIVYFALVQSMADKK